MKGISGILLSTITAAFLVGCGGGSGSSSTATTSTVTTATTSTGTFVDAPVKGLHYKTATQEGDTNENGEFKYIAGETIEFKLGNLSLGSVNADGLVTPYTLENNSDISNPGNKATNIALLLQNFDTDRTDGILDVTNIKDMDLSNFKLDDALSDMEANISAKLADNGFVTTSKVGSTTLINSDAAKTDMKKYVAQAKLTTSLVSNKTLVVTDSEGDTTLTFNKNGTYFESGYDSEASSNYSCSGLWRDLGNNKIAFTCDDNGTNVIPDGTVDNLETVIQFTNLNVGTSATVTGDNGDTPITIKSIDTATVSSNKLIVKSIEIK
jgi:hypothetical protein